jgi:L-asparaginase / beta-aspartyl-peptidase
MRIPLVILLLAFISFTCNSKKMILKQQPSYALVIHGGAGTILRKSMTLEREAAYRQGLDEALTAGEAILSNGGSALDAVEAVVVLLENNPLFNAGKGAVFTAEGTNEMDASIMRGDNLQAGAVSGIRRIKNPIRAARAVMEHSPHVFLSGEGAEAFAEIRGLEMADAAYFYTEERWKALEKARNAESQGNMPDPENKKGTVGAVALDMAGNISAATSTGGMTNKRYNRIGDTPVIGAGTYADNRTCGISSTGHGEYFIRLAVAHDIHAQMLYGGKSLSSAARQTIQNDLSRLGGEGGIIGLDKKANIVMEFNSEGMYRGYVLPGKRYVGIYKD